MIQPDEIFQLQNEYTVDPRKTKINGGIGVYLDEWGKPYVLPVVKKAVSFLKNTNFNYLPISGDPDFLAHSAKLVLGPTLYSLFGNMIASQGVSGGTNGLFIWGSLMKQLHKKPTIILSRPTWENHKKIFSSLGFTIVEYNHVTPDNQFDFDSFQSTISQHPKDYVLLHGGSTHNPTGINPNKFQWIEVVKLLKEYQSTVLVDFAYMGLGQSIDQDCYPIRLMVKNHIPVSIVISYSKNMTLYQHRTGALLVMGKTKEERETIEHHLKYIFRIVNSNPPAFGELVVKTILESTQLKDQWYSLLENMVQSLRARRTIFIKASGDRFAHILRQKGLFSLLNLPTQHIDLLKKKYGIYLLSNSRINFGGISLDNAQKVARAILHSESLL